MADYIQNMLRIESEDREFIDRFMYAFTCVDEEGLHRSLDFTRIAPQPPQLTLQQTRGEMDNELHQWRLENWGTKWNSFNEDSLVGEYNEIYFKTVWNPPFAIIEKLSSICPDVRMTLYSVTEFGDQGTESQFLGGDLVGTIHCKYKEGLDRMFELVTKKKKERLKMIMMSK